MSDILRRMRPVSGDVVTIWPCRSRGESYDTEPGLQPWQAEFLGWRTDGEMIVRSYHGPNVHSNDVRFLPIERLWPS